MGELLTKYNVPGPRYTSYPTVPYWDKNGISVSTWTATVLRSFLESNDGIGVYIHLPYCESLCTFCGCNKKITKNHHVELPYIEAVLKEWQMYIRLLDEKPIIKDLHIGGGTPTFFSPDHLDLLLTGIMKYAIRHSSATFGIEGHPNNTTEEHLAVLRRHHFERLSIGIQDFDPKVQEAINRIQSYEQVVKITQWARKYGYTSVNYDVVYGLPFQTVEGLTDTFQKIGDLMPERIAFYSYAHVPWIKGTGQRKFSEEDLPSPVYKRQLYETGRAILEKFGYVEIGMDHFALPYDALYQSLENQTLHRNFMGYTPLATQVLIGLGASSISDTWYSFAQNEKEIEIYLQKVNSDEFPIFRGHLLSEEDLRIRRHILNLMCRLATRFTAEDYDKEEIVQRLAEMLKDRLVVLTDNDLVVLPEGRAFLRNICMAFDKRLWKDQPQTKIFSMTI
ncbi:MAG: oxygen-independent coproporphyrinogen III oxidase [Flammeovirgaceae bacterium]|nr:oxygen-independent coproporphyrinogen III oxidase [Flammeovirgaceae bacterium]MDW8287182.1 oxygen-independent coproporphyrinogen III oxidase [Flammeovirgaceae bacterium]